MLHNICSAEVEMLQSPANENSQDISIQFNRATPNQRLSRIQKVTGHSLYPQHAQPHIIVVNLLLRSIDGHICLPLTGKCVELLLDRHFFHSKFLHLALVGFGKRIRPPFKIFALSPFSRHFLAGYPDREILLSSLLHPHEASLTMRENLLTFCQTITLQQYLIGPGIECAISNTRRNRRRLSGIAKT